MTGVVHALSVDVEDWFQVLNMRDAVPRARWEDEALRCGDSTRSLLRLFAAHGAKATFFCLGWIAERLPDLVREIAAAGHEIGSHGYDHKCLQELGPERFRAEVQQTAAILAPLAGAPPRVFRACTWSITRDTLWALPILAELGYRLDSSVFPVLHPEYGIAGAPTSPYRVPTAHGELIEFPPLTLTVLGRRLAVGGGGYLRLFPLWLLERGLAQQAARGMPGCVYLHPWEVDPGQPRQRLGPWRGFRHYVNLAQTHAKLTRLLARHRFTTVTEALAGRSAELPLRALAAGAT